MQVAVTGATGFLGRNVVLALERMGQSVKTISRKEVDLLDAESIAGAIEGADVVIHLAANVGGVGYLRENLVAAFFDNFRMGLNVVNACLQTRPRRLVLAGTPCSYAENCKLPLTESDLLTGLPSGDTGSYGLAKISVSLAANALCLSAGIDVATVIPSNLYGPYDRFNTTTSHVVAALITKALSTPDNGSFSVWGDGKATRDFVFVEDVAEAIAHSAVREEPFQGAMFNLGKGVETSIAEIAHTIAKVVGRGISPSFDITRPVGYSRRVSSIDLASTLVGYRPKTSLEEGVARTVAWLRDTEANRT
ncbi:GDP-L-fucose synthase [Pleomorphomonas diazotrophica]|nr:NAD-dependent epimerase/dehydratase family protein [Pleomorphomonas diazotrophica]SFM88204.1 GDP-L-fucose synthase [Pleomorphomonas diazotrophica]